MGGEKRREFSTHRQIIKLVKVWMPHFKLSVALVSLHTLRKKQQKIKNEVVMWTNGLKTMSVTDIETNMLQEETEKIFRFPETKHPPCDINNMEGEKGGVNVFYPHRKIATLVKFWITPFQSTVAVDYLRIFYKICGCWFYFFGEPVVACWTEQSDTWVYIMHYVDGNPPGSGIAERRYVS